MFKLRKKKKLDVSKLKDADLQAIFHKELEPYIKREELQEYLNKIHKDEEKQRKWDSLSTTKKLQLLRYILSKKGDSKDEMNRVKR